MAKTNYDKFLKIETMMDEARELMQPYEDALKERYDYMNELRREYSNLSHALGRIEQSLQKQSNELEEDEDVKTVVKAANDKLSTHIEAIEEDNQYGERNDAVKQLKRAKEQLEGKVDVGNIETAWRITKARGIDIEEINVLMDLMDAMKSNKQDDVIQSVISKIVNVQNEYVSSFVTYRNSYDEEIDVASIIASIINELEDGGYEKEAQTLEDAKPSTTEARGKRPNPEPLLDILKPIKSAELLYFQSNNKKSESYSLNKAFAYEVGYTRRALLEDREYKGTESAFDRLNTAYDNLSGYMYERFYQLGGDPKNYHGHDDRVKK
ncbi:hypothetical protein [Staphylococcus equorum]|uniref:hypothetical protein n=1 Tax=Staphylococcus equorum TaxID=246432 RepID=UPI001867AA79|nr:hypothetical protein [Staphylococcus equorum]